ncbi:MAG: hypothetical protein ABIP48_31065 [Planctomycetota bacterium]
METVDSIVSAFGESRRDVCSAAIERLKTFQCIAIVHLHHPNDYAEQSIKSGKTARLVYAKSSEGYGALQITERGQEVLGNLFGVRLRRMLGAWFNKFADDYIRLLLALLLGMFLSSVFGWKLDIFPQVQDGAEQSHGPEPAAGPDSHGESSRPAR